MSSPHPSDPPLARSRVVLVGDASEPVGRAIALLLAERGHTVLAVGQDATAMADLPRETMLGGILEVTTVAAGQRAARARALFGRLDAVVATTSALAFGALDDATIAERLSPLARTLALVAEARAELRGGRVLLVTTLPSLPLALPAAAMRAALAGIADPLRLELRELGTLVITVATDLVRTPAPHAGASDLLERALAARPSALAVPLRAAVRALSRRAPLPAAVAEVVLRALVAPRPKPRYVLRTGGRLIGRPTRPLERQLARGKA
ncbi:MAG: hypothetical protein U1F43_24230 [Myxococcota bacterium]